MGEDHARRGLPDGAADVAALGRRRSVVKGQTGETDATNA